MGVPLDRDVVMRFKGFRYLDPAPFQVMCARTDPHANAAHGGTSSTLSLAPRGAMVAVPGMLRVTLHRRREATSEAESGPLTRTPCIDEARCRFTHRAPKRTWPEPGRVRARGPALPADPGRGAGPGQALLCARRHRERGQGGALLRCADPRCDDKKLGCIDPNTVSWHVEGEATGLDDLSHTSFCLKSGAAVSVEACSVGDDFRVDVESRFQLVTPLVSSIFGSDLVLRSTAVSSVNVAAFDPNATPIPIRTTPSPTPTPTPTASPGPSSTPTPTPVASAPCRPRGVSRRTVRPLSGRVPASPAR